MTIRTQLSINQYIKKHYANRKLVSVNYFINDQARLVFASGDTHILTMQKSGLITVEEIEEGC